MVIRVVIVLPDVVIHVDMVLVEVVVHVNMGIHVVNGGIVMVRNWSEWVEKIWINFSCYWLGCFLLLLQGCSCAILVGDETEEVEGY